MRVSRLVRFHFARIKTWRSIAALLEDEMAALSSGSTWKEPEKRNSEFEALPAYGCSTQKIVKIIRQLGCANRRIP